MKISGYTSRPSSVRKDTSRMMITINQRFVSSPVITAAIKDGYSSLLPRDMFPSAFLSLTIDTSLVDVNVHPTKKQVRLSREKEITQAVRDAVKTALLSHNLIPHAGQPSEAQLSETCGNTEAGSDMHYDFSGSIPEEIRETVHAGTFLTDRQLRQTELSTGIIPVDVRLPALEVIGQFGGIYILATTDTGELILIDQHAIHERILYEQVTTRTEGIHRSQELIIPVLLHRTLKDASILRDIIPELAQEGFILEEFGKGTFLVRAIPVVLGKLDDTTLIDAMVSDLVNEEAVKSVNNREKIARIIACRGAIKAGTVCSREQCQRLVQQIRYVKNPFTCPHGRPTMIRFSRDDLDTMFKRT
jgi:DNA mismatch repair protein MutL